MSKPFILKEMVQKITQEYFEGTPLDKIKEKFYPAADVFFSPDMFRPHKTCLDPVLTITSVAKTKKVSYPGLTALRSFLEAPAGEHLLKSPVTYTLFSDWWEPISINAAKIRLALLHHLWQNREKFFLQKDESGRTLFYDLVLHFFPILPPFIFTKDEWERYDGGGAVLQKTLDADTNENNVLDEIILWLLHQNTEAPFETPYLTPIDLIKSAVTRPEAPNMLWISGKQQKKKRDPLRRTFLMPLLTINIFNPQQKNTITDHDLTSWRIPIPSGDQVKNYRFLDLIVEDLNRYTSMDPRGIFWVLNHPAIQRLLTEPTISGDTILEAACKIIPAPTERVRSDMEILESIDRILLRLVRKDPQTLRKMYDLLQNDRLRHNQDALPLTVREVFTISSARGITQDEWYEDYMERS